MGNKSGVWSGNDKNFLSVGEFVFGVKGGKICNWCLVLLIMGNIYCVRCWRDVSGVKCSSYEICVNGEKNLLMILSVGEYFIDVVWLKYI